MARNEEAAVRGRGRERRVGRGQRQSPPTSTAKVLGTTAMVENRGGKTMGEWREGQHSLRFIRPRRMAVSHSRAVGVLVPGASFVSTGSDKTRVCLESAGGEEQEGVKEALAPFRAPPPARSASTPMQRRKGRWRTIPVQHNSVLTEPPCLPCCC